MKTRLLLLTVLASSFRPCTASSEELTPLSVGRQETHELETGETHVYGLAAEKGQFVLGEAFQASVDVAVTVTDPDGEPVGTFDGPARGPESIQFQTRKAGLYRISIAPFKDEQGEYSIRILRQEPLAETPAGKVDQMMAAYRADTPGGVVAVVRGGEIVFGAGYGLANVEYGAPNAKSTPYHMASVSKQFTAFAVVLLSLEGKLALDDDVRKYLPELPDFGHVITLRHLLNHTQRDSRPVGPVGHERRAHGRRDPPAGPDAAGDSPARAQLRAGGRAPLQQHRVHAAVRGRHEGLWPALRRVDEGQRLRPPGHELDPDLRRPRAAGAGPRVLLPVRAERPLQGGPELRQLGRHQPVHHRL